jgi:hypothetical protein
VSFQGDLRKFKKPLTQYLRENFYVTTSGFFRTQALNAVLSEIGEDRVLFVGRRPVRIEGAINISGAFYSIEGACYACQP